MKQIRTVGELRTFLIPFPDKCMIENLCVNFDVKANGEDYINVIPWEQCKTCDGPGSITHERCKNCLNHSNWKLNPKYIAK